jgi:hypothetical protein
LQLVSHLTSKLVIVRRVATLVDSTVEGKAFSAIDIRRADELDWIECSADSSEFKGYCGPGNLEEMLCVFIDWAESETAGAQQSVYGLIPQARSKDA